MGDMPEKIWIERDLSEIYANIHIADDYQEIVDECAEYTRSDLTTELAEALEEAYWDRAGWVEKAKAALKKAGR